MIRYALCLLCLGLPQPGQADSLLALPEPGGTISFWNTGSDTPERVHQGLTAGSAGVCYRPEDGRLVAQEGDVSCLQYLVLQGDLQTGGAPPYQIIGRLTPLERGIDEVFTGFAVTGVSGVGNCGERGNCDTIYIVGVSSEGLLEEFASAVVSGEPVTVSGPGVWQFESIDIFIEDISAAPR